MSEQVRQLRLVVEASDFDEAVAFYRDVLGLDVELDLESEGGAHVVILQAGRATLEISNPAQVDLIDGVEVGRRVSPHLRVAFEVSDVATTTTRLAEAGAEADRPAHPHAVELAQRPALGAGRAPADALRGARRRQRLRASPNAASSRSTSSSLVYADSPTRTPPSSPRPRWREASRA